MANSRLFALCLFLFCFATVTATIEGSSLPPAQEQTTTQTVTEIITETSTITNTTTCATSLTYTFTYTIITSTSTEKTTATATHTTTEIQTTSGTATTIWTVTERTTESISVTATETKTTWNLDSRLVLNLEAATITIGLIIGAFAGVAAYESVSGAVRRVLYGWTGLVAVIGVLVAACGAILELNGLYLGFTLIAWSTLGILVGFVAVSIVVSLWRQSQPTRPDKAPKTEQEEDD